MACSPRSIRQPGIHFNPDRRQAKLFGRFRQSIERRFGDVPTRAGTVCRLDRIEQHELLGRLADERLLDRYRDLARRKRK